MGYFNVHWVYAMFVLALSGALCSAEADIFMDTPNAQVSAEQPQPPPPDQALQGHSPKVQGQGQSDFPLPVSVTTEDYVQVYVGRCAAVDPLMARLDDFVSTHPGIRTIITMMQTDGNDFPRSLERRELTLPMPKDIAAFGIDSVPTTIIREKGKIHKIVGAVNIGDYKGMTIEATTPNYILMAEKGPTCPAKAVPSRLGQPPAKTKLPDFQIIPPVIPRVNLPRAEQVETTTVLVPQVQYAPVLDFFVVSAADMKTVPGLLNKGFIGCCVDCDKFTTGMSPCNADLLKTFSVSSTPAHVHIDFPKGKAIIKEGK